MLITLPKSPPLARHPSHQGPLRAQGVQSAEQGVGLSEPRRQSGKSTPTTVATMVLALCRKKNSWILRIITGTFPTIPSLHCASLWRAQAPTHPFQLKEPLPSQSSAACSLPGPAGPLGMPGSMHQYFKEALKLECRRQCLKKPT